MKSWFFFCPLFLSPFFPSRTIPSTAPFPSPLPLFNCFLISFSSSFHFVFKLLSLLLFLLYSLYIFHYFLDFLTFSASISYPPSLLSLPPFVHLHPPISLHVLHISLHSPPIYFHLLPLSPRSLLLLLQLVCASAVYTSTSSSSSSELANQCNTRKT